MPQAALILANIDADLNVASQPLLLTLGGQTLLERMAEQARRAGCGHIIVCASPLPGAMIGAMDRLKSRGMDMSLARSPREAADLLHPEDSVLLFASAVILPEDELDRLVTMTAPALLTLPEAWGRDRFERIDNTDNWAGVGLLPASLIRETVAMLGDWAFGPTLLRRAVQQGAQRRPIHVLNESETDEMCPIAMEDLAGSARALVRTADIVTHGWVERLALLPPLKTLAAWLFLKPVSANMAGLAALLFGIAGITLAGIGQMMIAPFLIFLGHGLAILARLLGYAGLAERRSLAPFLRSREIWLPISLVAFAGRAAFVEWDQFPLALLSLWFAVQTILTLHAAWRGAELTSWRLGSAGNALILGVAFLLGQPMIGLGLCLAGVIIVQAIAQHRTADA